MIVIYSPLRIIRGTLITGCGSFMLIGGILSLTGYGLVLPWYQKLGGTSISLMGSLYISIIGFVFVILGVSDLLSRPARREIRALLKEMKNSPDSFPDEKEAANALLETINKHSVSQDKLTR